MSSDLQKKEKEIKSLQEDLQKQIEDNKEIHTEYYDIKKEYEKLKNDKLE